jgi:regulatory protein
VFKTLRSLRLVASVIASSIHYFYASLVFPRPRTVDSEPALYEAAIKILTRRAHSVYEMKKALIRRTADEELIRKVIERLKQNGLIDDASYAKQFARNRAQFRKHGRYRIASDLRARGVPDRHIQPALVESASNTDEAAMVRQRIERKLKFLGSSHSGQLQVGRAGAALDDKKIASLYRSLLHAGFSADTVRRELRRLTREDVPESAAVGDASDEP